MFGRVKVSSGETLRALLGGDTEEGVKVQFQVSVCLCRCYQCVCSCGGSAAVVCSGVCVCERSRAGEENYFINYNNYFLRSLICALNILISDPHYSNLYLLIH